VAVLLKELSEARGVSGAEGAVRDLILDAVRDLIDEHRVDALGNLICIKRGSNRDDPNQDPKKVMVAAHMDEVGFMVTAINKDGSLRISTVGGLDDRILLSKVVLVGEDAGDGPVAGVIGFKPIHLIPRDQRGTVPKISDLAVDIGASDQADAGKRVKRGDYVSFQVGYEVLDEGGLRTVKGKAFDDRVGCAILIEILRQRYAFDLYAVFTTQEEVGLRGARVAAYAVDPDVAFALEGTICDDLPSDEDQSPVTEVGKGPAITLMDASFIADRRLVRLLTETAEAEGLPYQFKRAIAGGTDSGAIHLAREGVPSVTVAVPCRYIHAPVSLLSLADAEHTVELMIAALQKLEEGLSS
jgi:tetrahedral aminopeptidase